MLYYGHLPHQLFIMMAAFGVAVRERGAAGSVTSAPMATPVPAG
jgi:hypothetical protein